MTFLQLLTDLKARCGLSNDSTFDSLLKRWLNNGQQNFTTRYLWDFLKDGEDITTVSGTDTYALTVEALVYDARDSANSLKLRFIKDIDLDRKDPLQTQTGRPLYYLTAGQYQASASSGAVPQLRFYPVPDSAYTIKTRYYKRLSDLVNDSDVSEIPAAFHELLVNYAANIYFSSQGDNRATEQFDLYENGLLSAVEQLGAVPADQIDVVRSVDERSYDRVHLPPEFGMWEDW